MIRVLVVDDSAFMRKLISDFLNEQPDIRVENTARNGKDALRKLSKKTYDVVTLDVEMPVMDGIEALKQIMAAHPCPIVMVSSLTQSGAKQTIEALAAGAVDVVAKPSGAISLHLHEVKDDLVHKVKAAARANIHASTRKYEPAEQTSRHADKKSTSYARQEHIVAIAASTGGPKALQQILPRLKPGFPAPIFVVQHMPPAFTKSLAERLNRLSAITVKEAEHGETAEKGTAYIAPGGYHLQVKRHGFHLVNDIVSTPPLQGNRPSADILFSSLSLLNDYQTSVLVLTGMGKDGSKGLLQMKRRQHDVLSVSESERTAVVYGMPKAAAETAGTDYQMDLDYMASFLNKQHGENE
ncbi:two-component system, chemotaxis family, response regulator CheB [Alteribacillus persepolensis]|uniref:Protein-glutamate methylesterase/protein-glutamine glutaminase n=1 Tax=Alteribacillus persepolensis TaxID=568899 RepID=A0A1G7YQ22_9BACI|nr:chemotaxis response regulator protein-glutamate methylesterase [Alteribacillus persepolensis]SDG98537.1 two-component system, chemotaxis family, response regulator CheB [Alteribacillus persepolensis]